MRKCAAYLFILIAIISWNPSRAAQMKLSGALEVKGDFILKDPLNALSFPDGKKQTSALPCYFATVIVNPGATPLEGGANLSAALSKIIDASPAKRYLIKVEPGIYDVGTGSLSMKDYVDIEGSGENCTKLTGAPDARYSLGVVNGANHCSLRLLTVEHAGGTDHCVAIYNSSASMTIDRTRIITSAAKYALGIENRSSELLLRASSVIVSGPGSPNGIIAENTRLNMSDFKITSTGPSGAGGMSITNCIFTMDHGTVKTTGGETSFPFSIYASTGNMEGVDVFSSGTGRENTGMICDGSEVSLSRVRIEASGAETNTGIFAGLSVLTIDDSQIRGQDGSYARGVVTQASQLVITSSIVEGSGGSALNVGVVIQGDPRSLKAFYSTFKGSDQSIGWQNGWTFDLAACKLEGPIVTAFGTWRCASCYTGSYTSLNAGCSLVAP